MFHKIILLALALTLPAQQIVTTLAGTEWVFPANGAAALNVPIAPGLATAIDPQGRLVYADSLNHVVVRIESNNTVTVIAGNGVRGFSGDGGDARRASFDQPRGVAIDKVGNIYISDGRNFRVRRVDTRGIVTTFAGRGINGFGGDGGPATAANISPWKLTVDPAGNLYIADYDNSRLRKVSPDGIIDTIAGNGKNTYSGDGKPARESSLVPFDLAVDPSGRIIVSDTINVRVYRIGTDGIINSIAGTGTRGYSGDGGPAVAAALTNPSGVTVDVSGNVLIADTSNRRVRRVNAAGLISTIAGGGGPDVTTTASDPLRSAIGLVSNVVYDGQGRLYITDSDDPRVLLMSTDGRSIQKIAGNGKFKELPPNTPASLVTITEPMGIAVTATGAVYFSEFGGHRVNLISREGLTTTITGNGVNTCCVDGPAATGRVSFPAGLAIAPDGALLIADSNSQKIRRIANGQISSIAGTTFVSGFAGDGGPAINSQLSQPWGIVVDPAGNIYFSERTGHRIRRIDPRGTITTYAGNGLPAYSGDGGKATEASLNAPSGLAFNTAGELLIADYANHRIRAVSSTGNIRTIAGTGVAANSAEGVRFPFGLATDKRGNIYFTSDGTGLVRRIDPNGVISTFAGTNAYGFSGDGGAPSAATFSRPFNVATDDAGNVYIADTQNNRIRVVRSVTLTSSLAPSPVNLTAVTGSATASPARVTFASAVSGLPFATAVTYGQTPGNWLTITSSSESLRPHSPSTPTPPPSPPVAIPPPSTSPPAPPAPSTRSPSTSPSPTPPPASASPPNPSPSAAPKPAQPKPASSKCATTAAAC